MTTDSPRYNSPFLNTGEAGNFLNISPRTLEKFRVTGGGPQFRKLGSRVLYAIADLHAWADSKAYSNTSETQGAESCELKRSRRPVVSNERPFLLSASHRRGK
jgi:hypothetical protein